MYTARISGGQRLDERLSGVQRLSFGVNVSAISLMVSQVSELAQRGVVATGDFELRHFISGSSVPMMIFEAL